MKSGDNLRAALMLALGLGGAGGASAAPVVVVLDQSNVLADGRGYLQVAVAEGTDGAIDFTVRVLDPLRPFAGAHFGIQSLAFNVAPGGSADAASVTNLPAGWTVRDGYRMDGFGLFDIKLYGGGDSRLDTLSFSITGIDGDRPEDYAVLSTGKAGEGHQFFAARVADLAGPSTSAFFGGSTAVPAPAAGWLSATAAIALARRLRRRVPRPT